MKPLNPDNVFGSRGSHLTFGLEETGHRGPFINRPTKGKTARKKRFPPSLQDENGHSHKTNIGDPMKGQSSGGKKKKG